MGLPMIFTALSGAISAIGAIQQANAQAAASEYNARIDARNRLIADQNRKVNVRLAELEAEDMRRDNARTMSTIRAAYGGSGLDIAGSPLDVLQDTAFELELDVSRTEYQARQANREGAIQMTQFGERSVLNRMEARNAKKAGVLSAFGYLASTGAKMSSMAGDSLMRTA